HWRTARPHPGGPQSLVRGGKHFRVIGKAEIIIRTEIDHRAWFPAVVNHRARICTGEELRFVQFNRPRAETYPVRKARWSLQRIVAFARQKIAQTKFCRVLVHETIYCGSLAPVVANGVSQQN